MIFVSKRRAHPMSALERRLAHCCEPSIGSSVPGCWFPIVCIKCYRSPTAFDTALLVGRFGWRSARGRFTFVGFSSSLSTVVNQAQGSCVFASPGPLTELSPPPPAYWCPQPDSPSLFFFSETVTAVLGPFFFFFCSYREANAISLPTFLYPCRRFCVL